MGLRSVTSVTLLDDVRPKVICLSFIQIPALPFVGEGIVPDFVSPHTLMRPAVPKAGKGVIAVFKLIADLHFSSHRRQINSFLHKQLSNDKVIRGPFTVRLRFVYGPFSYLLPTKQFGINLFEDELSGSGIAVFDAFGNFGIHFSEAGTGLYLGKRTKLTGIRFLAARARTILKKVIKS